MFGWGRCGALLGILCVLCGAICAPVPGAAQAATHQPDKHGAVGVASPAVVLSPDAATATATATGTTDHAAGVHWHPIEDRKRVHELLLGGQYVHATRVASETILSGRQGERGEVGSTGAVTPNMYHLLGLARYYTRDLEGARKAFARAVVLEPERVRSWNNFAECSLYSFHFGDAALALDHLVIERALPQFVSKLYVHAGVGLGQSSSTAGA